MTKRIVDISKFKQSVFLLGPRQAGKTYLVNHSLDPQIYINLLSHREYIRYSADPSVLISEVSQIKKDRILIVIDEIQRCPDLLNEVQILIEKNKKIKFVLTGSSARKLKHAGVNLLGGRAINVKLYPYVYEEIRDSFNLDEVLKFGSIPGIIANEGKQDIIRALNAYVDMYLKEEIQQESLVRNMPAFAKFMELAAHENGKILNFQSLAQELGLHSKTIKEYYQILEDTLLGFWLYPYTKSHRTKLVAHPKFYLFDCGVVRALKGELTATLSKGTVPYGYAFEHFIILEIARTLDYREREYRLSFFRTADGAEVDLILEICGKVWAVEIKSAGKPSSSDLRGLKSFISDHKYSKAICVCNTPRKYAIGDILCMPWQEFIEML